MSEDASNTMTWNSQGIGWAYNSRLSRSPTAKGECQQPEIQLEFIIFVHRHQRGAATEVTPSTWYSFLHWDLVISCRTLTVVSRLDRSKFQVLNVMIVISMIISNPQLTGDWRRGQHLKLEDQIQKDIRPQRVMMTETTWENCIKSTTEPIV